MRTKNYVKHYTRKRLRTRNEYWSARKLKQVHNLINILNYRIRKSGIWIIFSVCNSLKSTTEFKLQALQRIFHVQHLTFFFQSLQQSGGLKWSMLRVCVCSLIFAFTQCIKKNSLTNFILNCERVLIRDPSEPFFLCLSGERKYLNCYPIMKSFCCWVRITNG